MQRDGFRDSDLLNQTGSFFEVPVRRQRLLVHVVRVRPADLQLDDEVDEDWLQDAVAVLCLQIAVFVVLNRLRQCRVHKLPPVSICSLTLLVSLSRKS